MTDMTPEQHRAKSEKLLKLSRGYRSSAGDRNAAGSAIRAGWAKQADVFLAEAQLHATLSVTVELDERLDAWESIARHPFFDECYSADGPLIAAMLGKLASRMDAVPVEQDEWCREQNDNG